MSADVGSVFASLLELATAHGGVETAHGDLVFDHHVNADHGLVLDGGGAIVFEDGLVVTGDLVLTHASSVIFKGSVEVTGNVIIDAAASILFGNHLTAGGTVALASDEVDFLGGAGSAGIVGDLTIKVHTVGLPIHVGFTADTSGSLGLTDADLAALNAGGKVMIGAPGSYGLVLIDSAEFRNDVSIVGSDVTIQHTLLAHGARVALVADPVNGGSGIVRNDGLINVSASARVGHAGEVLISGSYAGNFGTILARGSDTTSGGSVRITSTIQTLVASAGVIDASGGSSGGSVILWSDNNTTVAGRLSARGGHAGGDGGFIEVSSAGGFSLTGHVDTTAVAGKTGMLLLDPKNVIITAAGAGLLTDADAFSTTPSADVTISVGTITGAASAVTIQANNDITVNAALSMIQDLTLQAGRSVLVNQNISLTNKTLTIVANDHAGIDVNRDAGLGSITTLSGVTLSAGNGTINLTVEVGDIGAPGGITIDKVITTGTLNVSTAGFVRETSGDAAPAAGSMTSEDDLTAGTLNLIVTGANATFGEPLDQPNGALEVAAGTLNADVQLPLLPGNFAGYFVLTDADHTNGSPGGNSPSTIEAPMVIGTFNAGAGSVILTAKGASIHGTAGTSPNITARQINLTTEFRAGPDVIPFIYQPISHYGSIGTAAAPIRTEVALLTATASDGGIFIHEATSVMINSVIAQDRGVTPQAGANGTVIVTPAGGSATAGTSDAVITAGGDIVVVEVKVADQLSLSSGGLILDGNQDSGNILSRGLVLNAAGAIGDAADLIETSVMTLQATTIAGGVFIAESDGANVSSITAGGTGYDVTLTSSTGSLVLGAITAAGGDVTVNSQSEGITDGNGATANITAGTASLQAGTNIGSAADAIEVSVGGLSTKATNNAAATNVVSAGTLTSLAIETNNGAVGLTLNGGSVGFVQPGSANQLSLAAPGMATFSFSNSGGSVALKSIDAGTGSVSITAKTFINDFAIDTTLNLKAGAVTLKAGSYIGTAANAIETDLDTLTASADAGGIFITDAGDITSLTATAKGAGNDIAVTTVGDLLVAKVTAPDAVSLTSAAGSIRRIGNVLNVSAANFTLQAGAAIGASDEPLILSGGTVNSAIANGGGIFLKAKGVLTATAVSANGGDLELSADKDMTLGLVATDLAHAVKLTSTYGGILDGNGAAVNIRGSAANLTAVRIGTTTDAIDTDVDSLTAVGSSGGVYINELNAVTVQRVEAQGLGSDIALTAGGNIILSVAKADGDKVNIKSTSGSIADGNGPALNITADQLDISAPGGIGALQNSVNKLGSANGGAGGVTISNIGALAITDATLEGRGAGKLTIQADSITILDMADNLATLDVNGSIQLTSLTGNVIFLDPKDTIVASGTGTIGITAGLGLTPSYPNTGAVAAIGNLTTAGGTISVQANHHITIGLLNTGGTGDVTVASETGVIIDGNGALPNIIGNTVTLSGASSNARTAQLETSIRIADYSAIRSEAAAKLTNAQSLSTATVIMNVQKNNALDDKGDALAGQSEAELAKNRADADQEAAYALQKVLEATSIALGLVRNAVEVGAGFAQAIPFSGDGGASGAWSILDLAASIADTAAFFAAIETDKLAGVAEEKANELTQSSAELTALSATYEDSLATWKAFDEATSVAQKAADAAAIARDHSLVVRDQAIFAEDQGNVIGTAANPLSVQAHQLNATATDGSVYLSVTGNFDLGGISATGANGVVSVAATGDIHVTGATKAPTQVTLNAGGSIIDGGGSIEAPKFLGVAHGYVGSAANPIHTTIATLAVKATTGTVGISNTGELEIGSIDSVNGVTAAGAVGVTSSDALTFKNAISAPGQTVTLLSQTGAIIDAHTGTPEVTALTLNATAAAGIALDTAIANLTALTTSAGSVSIHEADGITLTSVQTANGSISVEAGGTIVATSVVSQTDGDTNDIFLKATNGGSLQAGAIHAGLLAGDVTLDASSTGGVITMLGGGRVTADALVATAGSGLDITTTARSADLEVTGAGGLTVHEFDALLVNKLTTANGAVSLTTGGQVTLGEGAVNAAGGASDVTINAAGRIIGPLLGNGSRDILGAIVSLVTTGAGSSLGASLANPLEINATTRFDAQTQNSDVFINDTEGGVVIGLADLGLGNLYLQALAGSITSSSPGDGIADIVAAHIDLKVTGIASRIGLGEGSQLEIDGSTLTVLTAGGSAFLADTVGGIAIDTLNVGAGNLYLSATGGAISDDDGGAANNITATNLMLSATAGVGAIGNPIEAAVTALEGFGGTGGFHLTDLAGGLFLGGVTGALNGVSVAGGSIVITALSALTVDETVANTGGGDITLTATDSAGAGDDLIVNANITAIGGTGGVTLLGGDDVVLALDTTVNAPGGTVEIRGDNGDADPGLGSQLLLNGAIRANRLEVTSYGDDDSLDLGNAIVGSESIDTGAGDDEITIAAGNTLGTGTLDAGAGNDSVTISAAVENVLGGDGDDTLHVFAPVTTLDAGGDHDTVDISAAVGTFLGGLGDDLLLVKAGGSVTASADGGTGADQVVYDHDGLGGDDYVGPITVNLETRSGSDLASFSGFERFEATTNSNDLLIGANATNAWHITGTNAGDIGGAGVFDFTGFEKLTGGSQDDAFQFAASGKITGDLDGGGHALRDTIDYNGANFGAVTTVVLDGSNGGTATAIGGRFDRIDEVIGDADYSATNALTGGGADNVWTFTGLHAGNISNQFFFQHFGNTGGGAADDNFSFANNTLPPQPVQGGFGNNTLDLSAWTSDLLWNITGDGSGTVVTKAGTFAFSGMTKLIGGHANDRFTFSDDRILGQGLLSAGAIVGNDGTDFLDLSAYTTANLWSRTNLDGTIQTNRGTWTYSSIEGFLGSETTTYLFDVIDLTGTLTKVSMPAQLLPTEGGGVYMTLSNIGNDEALNRHINVSFFLSLDGKLDGGDVLIGENDNRLINLRPGDTDGQFYTATNVPFGTAPGMYHLLSVVDSGGAISEGDESNNVIDGGLIKVLPIQVDLAAVFTKSTLPDVALPGAKGTLTAIVTNLGNSPAKGLIDVEYFLSLDSTLDGGDIPLGGTFDVSIKMAAGTSRSFTFNAQVPDGTPVGDYQVLVRIDGKSHVLESNEINNIAAAAPQVHVGLPFVDLVGEFTRATLPTIGVPNDTLHFQVPVKNLGNIAAVGTIDVDFYLSVDGTVSPGTDVLLSSLHDVSINILPGGQRLITSSALIPTTILGGTFFVLADIDPTHAIAELNKTNNTAVSPEGLEVVWRFGSFADRRNVHLVVPDSHGNMVDFSIHGQGVGNVLGGSNFTEISLTGTDANTTIRIQPQGLATTEVNNITSTNSIHALKAPRTTLLGDLSINGTASGIQLGDVRGQHTITLGAPANPTGLVRLRFGHVDNLSITSGTPIQSLSVLNWLDTNATPDLIQAPWIGPIKSVGVFQADLLATT
jgi:hypothetical protein